jgi:2-polyprenyl-3-methyl-5-hydroxy-6-metoxy-1,4-benzoquinol methylase
MANKAEMDFILDFTKQDYPYFEEVNEGIVKQVSITTESLKILDVGAGRGILGEALGKKGYEVYAIESNTLASHEAKNRVHHVISADLHDMNTIKAELKENKFNYIIFSDVLEHVYDPMDVLKNYLPFLHDEGKILISLPNTVNWLNRLRFLFGQFSYEMSGVMDRTHIRFFTSKTAKNMLIASGCQIEKVDFTPFIVRAFLPIIKSLLAKNNNKPDSILESPSYKIYQKYLYPLEYGLTRLFPSLFAFRMIFVATKLTRNK